MTHVVAFLQKHGRPGVEMLKEQFAIKAKAHTTNPDLILFKYDQLNSPMSHPIVQECRGIVLDASRNWHVVVYPYQKFFNMKEVGNAAVIDWTSPVRVYEKIDGSLLTLYFSQGTWHVATSGIPDASGKLPYGSNSALADGDGDDVVQDEPVEQAVGPVEMDSTQVDENGLTPVGRGPNRKSFSELFWEVFRLLGYRLPEAESVDSGKCYMFELATPQNVVLIRHKRPMLYLHGVRDLTTLEEELPDTYVEKYGWTLAPMKEVDRAGFEREYLSTVNALNGLECEGYVVCDVRFNRFKLKCTSYVNLSLLHSNDASTWKRLVGIIQVNEGSEFLAYFPQHTELYNTLFQRYETLLDALSRTQRKFESVDPKTLASYASSIPQWIMGPLFITRKSKEDFKTFFSSPQRYGMLCGLLDPNTQPPPLPDLDAIQLPASSPNSK